MSNIKPIIIVIILACIGIGYYAWRQQKQALNELAQLKSAGIDVSFSVVSRPIIAIDKNKQMLYLLSGSGANNTVKLPFVEINHIQFIETPETSINASQPRGPDSLMITMRNGNAHRVGDLPKPAEAVMHDFQHQGFPSNQLSLKARK